MSTHRTERKLTIGSKVYLLSEATYAKTADTLTLEGVDGDGDINTVTYWYVRTNTLVNL